MCTITLKNEAVQDEKTNTYKDFSEINIPRYAYIDTGKTDTRGKKIYYSTYKREIITTGDINYNLTMYNGRWKMYSTIFTSNGDPY